MNFHSFSIYLCILAFTFTYTYIQTTNAVTTLTNCPVLQCVNSSSYDANLDYFPVKMQSNIHWKIEYFKSYKIFTNNLTATNANTFETYVLYKCGTPIPVFRNASNANSTIILPSSVPSNAKFFSIPLQKIALPETVPLAFLEVLGLRDTIKYMDTTYVTSPCARQAYLDGFIQTLPYDEGSPAFQQAVNASDAVFVGNEPNPNPKYIAFAVTDDETHFERINGYGFLSVFFDREDAANSIMLPMAQRYISIQSNATAASAQQRPVIGWITTYGLDFCVSQAPNKLDVVSDLNGIPLIISPTTNSPYLICTQNTTLFRERLLPADIIIDETYYAVSPTYEEQLIALTFTLNDTIPGSSPYKFLTTNQLIRDDGRRSPAGGDDWYEGSIANPDAVLGALAVRAYPDIVTYIMNSAWQQRMNTTYLWFRNIALDQSIQIVDYACLDVHASSFPLAQINIDNNSTVCPAWYTNPALYTQSSFKQSSVTTSTMIVSVLLALLASMLF